MKFGLRDFQRSVAAGFAADGKLDDFPNSAIQWFRRRCTPKASIHSHSIVAGGFPETS